MDPNLSHITQHSVYRMPGDVDFKTVKLKTCKEITLDVAKWLGNYFYEPEKLRTLHLEESHKILFFSCNHSYSLDVEQLQSILTTIKELGNIIELPEKYMKVPAKDLSSDADRNSHYFYYVKRGTGSSCDQDIADYIKNSPHLRLKVLPDSDEVAFVSEVAIDCIKAHIQALENEQKIAAPQKAERVERRKIVVRQTENNCNQQ